jgi:hypothetical protein
MPPPDASHFDLSLALPDISELVVPCLPWAASAAEGAARLLFVSPPSDVRCTVEVGEPVVTVDDLFVRHVVQLIEQFATTWVLLVCARANGRTKRCDRRLTRQVIDTLAAGPIRCLGFVVIGADGALRATGLMPAGAAQLRATRCKAASARQGSTCSPSIPKTSRASG